MKSDKTGPLEGLRVLDIATVIAGPFGATLLADYGAEVVKVELPGAGDSLRTFPPFKSGRSVWWMATQRNKKFITLDLRTETGATTLLRMLKHFDVLIENFRPGTLEKWGLTPERLKDANPNLVVVRVSAFGQDGPYRNRPGFARIFEAMGGLTGISGDPDGEPMHPGTPLGDLIGGLFCALGGLAGAWQARRSLPDRSDPGFMEVDLSLTEAILRLLDPNVIAFDQLQEIQPRNGNQSSYSAPAAVYRTKDSRWVTLTGSTTAVFARNCAAIGRSDLASDAQFSTNAARVGNKDQLNAIFSGWCAAHDLDEIVRSFDSAGGTIAPIYTMDQIFKDPQFIARSALAPVNDESLGATRLVRTVPRFTGYSGEIQNLGQALGKDNLAVLTQYADLSASQVSELASAKVI